MATQHKAERVRVMVFPGTFDPITHGHTDLIARASALFPQVIVAVAHNARKTPLFSLEERLSLARTVLAPYENVVVESFSHLLVDFVRARGAQGIIRGLRAVSDFEYELQLATINRRLSADIETLFLTPAEQYGVISSSLVKEIAQYKGDVSEFVSPVVALALTEKFSAWP